MLGYINTNEKCYSDRDNCMKNVLGHHASLASQEERVKGEFCSRAKVEQDSEEK